MTYFAPLIIPPIMHSSRGSTRSWLSHMNDIYQEHNTDVTVNIQQQPNDAADAARLYGELKDRAMHDFTDALVLNADNAIANIQVYSNISNATQEVELLICFSLNGSNCKAVITTSLYKIKAMTPVQLYDFLYNEAIKAIAYEIFILSSSKLGTEVQKVLNA